LKRGPSSEWPTKKRAIIERGGVGGAKSSERGGIREVEGTEFRGQVDSGWVAPTGGNPRKKRGYKKEDTRSGSPRGFAEGRYGKKAKRTGRGGRGPNDSEDTKRGTT